ncbi:MAG TPA: hypothetical protein VFV34_03895 [Blastocatellia bacterium]|nr:hypothetical protein [Blastocatellia bacterium]
MKRVTLFCLVVTTFSAGGITPGQSTAGRQRGPDGQRPCRFSIAGLWKSDETTQTNLLFNFSPEGWVVLLGHSPDALPQDFEVITSVNYKLSTPASPRRIEFTAARGNDIFPPGTTSFDIIEYNDDSFTTVNPRFAHQTRWVREQTHRYFLTLGARAAARADALDFAAWITLDGRSTKFESLGVQMSDSSGKPQPAFGEIPPEAYEQLLREDQEREETEKHNADKRQDIGVIRLELTPAEFERTHAVFSKWEKAVRSGALPHHDANENGIDFLRRVVDEFNQCSGKLKLEEAKDNDTSAVAQHDLSRDALNYIQMIRKKNGSWHVPPSAFPWGWRPSVQIPAR